MGLMSGEVCPLVLVNISYGEFGKDFQGCRGDDQDGGNVEKPRRWSDGWDYAVAGIATVLAHPKDTVGINGELGVGSESGISAGRTVISQIVVAN
jgi:hypothetical protein